jgi:Mlc titration factor MtfA (ptsG expression regulator)
MNIFQRAKIRYILHHHAIAYRLWRDLSADMPCLRGLDAVKRARLRIFSTLFLHEKHFVAVQGLALTEAMRVVIALQACLPVLELGFNCLSGWTDVVVYPAAFCVNRDSVDAAGVVHHEKRVLVGESWSRGPLVVSWLDVEQDGWAAHSGHNVVIHEIAHKLDNLNGKTNGFPPLHPNMSVSEWTAVLSGAYRHLEDQLEHRQHTSIDSYAASSPAEFFAVASEYFFCAPQLLHSHFADVYRQLQLYYRQDPRARQQTQTRGHSINVAY